MAHDEVRRADTDAWLTRAREDLQAAQLLAKESEALARISLFHCQQVVEKVLKAILLWHGAQFRKIHDLEELGERALQYEPQIRELLDELIPLGKYALIGRYPDVDEEPEPYDLDHALLLCDSLIESAVKRLTAE